MKNTIKFFGIITLVAMIGFTMTACSSGGSKTPSDPGSKGGGTKFQGQTLKTGTPSNTVLRNYGISSTDIQKLMDAARAVDSNYKGYYELTIKQSGMTMKILMFIWYNKTREKYNAVCDVMEDEMGAYWMKDLPIDVWGDFPPNTLLISSGMYDFDDDVDDDFDMNICVVQFYLRKYEDVPANTFALGFATVTF
jgi:hypothetical protein